MARARDNGLLDFFTKKKVTYRRSASAERDQLRRAVKAERKRSSKTALASYEGVRMWKLGTGGYTTSIDSSEFDSLKDAKAFVRSVVRSNPCAITRKQAVSDRAKRYRANQEGCLPDGPAICALCRSRSDIMVDHKDGDESNGSKSNLRWLCRSCNTRAGAEMARKGRGRRTAQYNKGAQSTGEYVAAVLDHTRGAHDAGGKIIHDTPKSRRREFASDIWSARKARGNQGKRNPEDAAAALSEAWHGRPAETATDYVKKIHFHGVLTDLGRLQELKVYVTPRKVQAIRFDAETRLASNEKGEQLYIEGGDQSLALASLGITGHAAEKDLVVVGAVYSVTYVTAKHHLGKADKTPGPYEHVFREHDQEEPELLYDTMNEEIGFAGGEYHIPMDDIDGRYSSGIND